jgi:hypothetical protein
LHDDPAITVYRSLDAWREHWASVQFLVDLARRIPRVGGMHYGAFDSLLRQ